MKAKRAGRYRPLDTSKKGSSWQARIGSTHRDAATGYKRKSRKDVRG